MTTPPKQTPNPDRARQLVRDFLAEAGLTKHSFAPLIGASHPAVRNWLDEGDIPSEPFRDAIEIVTSESSHPCPAYLWGKTPQERASAEKVAGVVPYRPPAPDAKAVAS